MKTNLNVSWISGFIDGDGSFAVDKVGPFYRPSLAITQNDPALLFKVKKYFGCGSVIQVNQNSWVYRCRSAKQFRNFILPRLKGSCFQTIKQVQYEILCEVTDFCTTEYSFQDLNHQKKLANYAAQIKASRSQSSYVNPNCPMNLDWFFGFFEAEGNFHLKIRNKKETRISYKVTQANYDLLVKIQDFFGFGLIHSEGLNRSTWKYNVEGHKIIIEKGLPLFEKHSLKGKKNVERVKFLKAARIVAKGEHQTQKGLNKLCRLEEQLKSLKH